MADLTITSKLLQDDPKVTEISFSGSMTIHHADEIKSAIVDAINGSSTIRLDLNEVTGIDLVGLQLICSAHRTAVTESKSFGVLGGEEGAFKQAVLSGGLTRHVGCRYNVDQSCSWVGGVSNG